MANKPFGIQGADLTLGGVNLSAGTTGVVIPGITQAATYFVEEVDDRGDQTLSFQTAPILIDYVTYLDYQNNGSSSGRAEYSVDELDHDGYIDGITIDAAGEYTGSEAYNDGNDLFAYTGTDTMPGIFTSFVDIDWTQVPFRPRMRAGNVEVIGGGGNANTGNFTFSDDTITNDNGLILETDRGTLAIGTNMEVPGVAGHFHIGFDGSNLTPPLNDLFLGDDYNYVKLPGSDLNPTTPYGVEIGAHNRDGGNSHTWRFGTDGKITLPQNGDIVDSDGNSVLGGGGGASNIWIQDFESTAGAPADVVGMATSVEYLANGDIVAVFMHYGDNNSDRYNSIGRFSTTGTKLWSMSFQGSQYTDGWGLAVDNVNNFIYVAGRSSAQYDIATLTKLAQSNGSIVWSKTYDVGYDNTNSVVDVASDGNPVVVGFAYNGTDNQIVTTKIDRDNGLVIWSKALNGQGDDEAYGMATGPSGEVVAVGYMDKVGVADAAATLYTDPVSNPNWGTTLYTETQTEYGIVVFGYTLTITDGVPVVSNVADGIGNRTVDGTFDTILGSQLGGTDGIDDLVVKVGTLVPNDNKDRILVAKYASDGTIAWQKGVTVETGFDCQGADADIDSDGNIYVCGTFNYDGPDPYSSAMIIIKFNSSGVKQWTRKVQGDCQDFATSIVVGSDNCLYLSAVTANTANTDFSMVVAKYNLDGTVAWQRLLDNTTTWTFAGGSFFGPGGSGSTIAVRTGYVAVVGGFGDPGNTVPHAILAQVDAAGTVFPAGDYDFKAASFTGLLDVSASNITVFNAGKTSSDYYGTFDIYDFEPIYDLTDNLVGTLYSSGIVNTGSIQFNESTMSSSDNIIVRVLGTPGTGTTSLYWYNVYGELYGSGDNVTTNGGVTCDTGGNVYTLGSFDGSGNTNWSSNNLFLKYDPQGNMLWSKTWTDEHNMVCGSFNSSLSTVDDYIYWSSFQSNYSISYVGGMNTDGDLVNNYNGAAQIPTKIGNSSYGFRATDIEFGGSNYVWVSGVSSADGYLWNSNVAATIALVDLASQTLLAAGNVTIANQDNSIGSQFQSMAHTINMQYAIGTYTDLTSANARPFIAKFNSGDLSDLTTYWINEVAVPSEAVLGESVFYYDGNVYVVTNNITSGYTTVSKMNLTSEAVFWSRRVYAGAGDIYGTGLAFSNHHIYLFGQVNLSNVNTALILVKMGDYTTQNNWSRVMYNNFAASESPSQLGYGPYQSESSSDIAISGDGDHIILTGITRLGSLVGSGLSFTVQYPTDGSIVGTNLGSVSILDAEIDIGLMVADTGFVLETLEKSVTDLTGILPYSAATFTATAVIAPSNATVYHYDLTNNVQVIMDTLDSDWIFNDAGALVLPPGSSSTIPSGQIFSGGSDAFINLDVQFATDTLGGVRIGTDANKPVDIVTNFPDNVWRFGGNGSMTMAGDVFLAANDGHIYIDNALSSATSIRWINTFGHSQLVRVYKDGREDTNNEQLQIGFDQSEDNGFYITTTGNINGIGSAAADDHTWRFGADGQLSLAGNVKLPFPYNGYAVVNSANNTVYGATLLLGGEAGNFPYIISTEPGQTDNINGKSILIQGSRSYGDGVFNSAAGGDVTIAGGYTAGGTGASITVHGGGGENSDNGTFGGNIEIFAGYDLGYTHDLPGSYYPGGQIKLQTSTYNGEANNQWILDIYGNLILPQGGTISEGSIPNTNLTGKTIKLTPYGGTNTNQQLLVYPTGGPGPDYNHLHLTSGNLAVTELFLGNDDQYVKLGTSGNVVIGTNSNNKNWTFDTTGKLTIPSGLTISSNVIEGAKQNTVGGQWTYATNVDGGTDNQGSQGVNLPVNPTTLAMLNAWNNNPISWSMQFSGEVGSVPVTSIIDYGTYIQAATLLSVSRQLPVVITSGNYQTEISANVTLTANTSSWIFGADGDLTLPTGGEIKTAAGTGNVVVEANDGMVTSTWTFSGDGTTTFPTGGHISSVGKGGTMLDGGFGGSTSLTNFYASGNYAACVSGYSDGNLSITTYNDGGPNPSRLWQFDNSGNITLPQTDMQSSPAPTSWPGITFSDGTFQKTAYLKTPTYGSFYSNITQTNTSVGDAIAISYNNTDISNGVSITGTGATEIRIATAGVYNIQFSLQVTKTDGGSDDIYIWLDKNGSTVDNTGTGLFLIGTNASEVASWNFVVNAAANDYYRLMWMSTDSHVAIIAVGAGAVVPAIPSVILTVVPVGA